MRKAIHQTSGHKLKQEYAALGPPSYHSPASHYPGSSKFHLHFGNSFEPVVSEIQTQDLLAHAPA